MSNAVPAPDSNAKVASCPSLPEYEQRKLDIWLKPAELDIVSKQRLFQRDTVIAGLLIAAYFVLALSPLKLVAGATLLNTLLTAWTAGGTVLALMLFDLSDFKRAYRIGMRVEKHLWVFGPLSMLVLPPLIAQLRAIWATEQGHHVEAQITLARAFWSSRTHKWLDPAIDTTLGNIYGRSGQFDRAQEIMEARYEASKKNGTRISQAVTTANMGWILFLKGEYKRSLNFSEEALQLVNRLPRSRFNNSIKLEIHINLARAQIRLGRYAEAEEWLEKAWTLASQLYKSMHLTKAEVQLGYAELRILQDHWDEALLYAQSAAEGYDDQLGPGVASRDYAMRLLIYVLRHLGRESDAHKLELQLEFDNAAMVETNENAMHDVRIRLLRGPR